jgi:hypothetical protein
MTLLCRHYWDDDSKAVGNSMAMCQTLSPKVIAMYTGRYTEPQESSPHSQTYFLMTHFGMILPSISVSL